jgi:hypothetical protein
MQDLDDGKQRVPQHDERNREIDQQVTVTDG